ncbi:MAG: hypothetical protein KAR79_03425, partial [Simkaniaceae bacterium]|nr:hypothetical protein [Simkaniaceae bacterium]
RPELEPLENILPSLDKGDHTAPISPIAIDKLHFSTPNNMQENVQDIALNLPPVNQELEELQSYEAILRDEYQKYIPNRPPLAFHIPIELKGVSSTSHTNEELIAHVPIYEYFTSDRAAPSAFSKQLALDLPIVDLMHEQVFTFSNTIKENLAPYALIAINHQKYQFAHEQMQDVPEKLTQKEISTNLLINHFVSTFLLPIIEAEKPSSPKFNKNDLEASTIQFSKKLKPQILEKTETTLPFKVEKIAGSILQKKSINYLDQKKCDAKQINQLHRMTFANLSRAPSIFADHIPVIYEDAFTCDVKISPGVDGNGYLFSLALTPNEKIQLTSINQSFYFIIDHTTTI